MLVLNRSPDILIMYVGLCLQNLLLKEEYQAPSRYVENKANAIEIREAAFEWDEDIDDDDDKPKPKQHQEDQKRSTESMTYHKLICDSDIVIVTRNG